MATPFPCPNPACSYRFDPAQLPAAAMVTCPLCRTRFPYRAAAPAQPAVPQQPAAYAPGYRYAQPAAPTPPADPGWSQVAAATGYTAPYAPAGNQAPETAPAAPFGQGLPGPAPAERPAGQRLIHARYTPKGGNASTYLMLGMFTLFLVAGLFIVYTVTQKSPWERTRTGPQVFEDFNFSYEVPDRWNADADARGGLQANTFALKRAGADEWVAMYVQDFKDHNPRPGEMRVLMRERLGKYFANVEMEEQGQSAWAKQPATHYYFTGEQDKALMKGECHLMSYKGIGYIFFAWASAEKFADHQKDFQAMRDRLSLLDKRERWTEKRSTTTVFAPKEGGCQVEDGDGVWRARQPAAEDQNPRTADPLAVDPSEIDPKATMALIARYPIKNAKARGIDFVPEAHALVLVLDKQAGDGVRAARDHILARAKKEDPDHDVVLEEVKESPSETPLPEGGVAMTRFQLRHPRDRDGTWYYIVSVLPAGGKLVVVETWCRNAGRGTSFASFMEPYMIKLAASLKAKG